MNFLLPIFFVSLVTLLLPASVAYSGANSGAFGAPSLAICGDSISTGAATHPNLEFDSNNLWTILNGEMSVAPKVLYLAGVEAVLPQVGAYLAAKGAGGADELLISPRRAWPTIKEYRTSIEWVALGLLRSVSETYLDTEEFSWGYQLGLAQNLEPNSIVIAAENGARSSNATAQIARVLKASDNVLPRKTYLFFTGNDICARSVDGMTSAESYEDNLFEAMSFALRNGTPAADGSSIIVPAFVNVTQLLTVEAIQTKLVRAFGGRIACGKLRENQFVPVVPPVQNASLPPEAALLSQVLPPNPAAMCPTLFGLDAKGADQGERIGALANRIREFRTAGKNAVARAVKLQKDKFADKSVNFHFVEETANFQIGADDVAEDCFHLSVLGQAKLARTIFDAELTLPGVIKE